MTITHTLFDTILYHPIRFLLYSPERILSEDLLIKERRWLPASGRYGDNNSLYVILVVSKYHRRKGVASNLMKKCVKYCRIVFLTAEKSR